MQYTNKTSHQTADTAPKIERVTKPREKNVKFLHFRSPSSLKEFRSYRTFNVKALKALCKIEVEKELLVDNGNKCKFYGRGTL